MLALFLYLNTLQNGFVYDDFRIVVHNACLTSDLPISTGLTRDVWCLEGAQATGSWRPLTFLWLRGLFAQAGFVAWPYHLANVLWFALAAGLAGIFVWRLSGSPGVALLAGLFYAAHPGHSEAVASIAGSADVLSAGLLFGGFVIYSGVLRNPGAWRARIGGIALLFLALMAKESAITGFAVLFLLELAWILSPDREEGPFSTAKAAFLNGRIVGPWLGSVVLIVGYIAIRHALFEGLSPEIHAQDNPLAGQPLEIYYPSAFAALGEYIRLMFWPLRLSVDYGYNQVPLAHGFVSWRVLGPAAAVIFSTVFACFAFKKHKVLSFGIFLTWSSLALASNLFVTIPTLVAERLLIVPNLGVAMVAASLLEPLTRRERPVRMAAAVAIVAVIVAMGLRVATRNTEWHSNVSLFHAAARDTPDSRKVQLNYAWFLRLEGAYFKALDHYRKADAIDPSLRDAFWEREMGICLHGLGDYANAAAHYRRALNDRPQDAAILKLLEDARRGVVPPDLHDTPN